MCQIFVRVLKESVCFMTFFLKVFLFSPKKKKENRGFVFIF